jgi:long-chain fatty acid transport protein
MIRLRNPVLTLTVALALAAPLYATNGYFTHGQGTASKGMVGATTAIAQDALDAETNPAATVFLNSGYSISMALFSPKRDYTVIGNPSQAPGTFGLTPGKVSSKSDYFPMPAVGYNHRVNENNALTFNLVAHGGMNTDYRTATFYGSDHTGVDLAQMFLSATYAHKLTANHALGISAVAVGQRFKASGLQAFSMFSSNAQNLTNNGYDTSYGVGVRLGYLGQLTPRVSIGAAYSPKIRMSDLKSYSGLFAQGGRFDIPSSLSAGIAFKPVENLTTALDYQRIHYSDVLAVGNPMMPNIVSTPLGTTGGAGFGWNDINIYKIGMQWKQNETWTWRAGYSKCDQPVPASEVLFNILAPGVVQDHITLGFSRQMKAPGRFNFAMMYAPGKTVTGANPLEVPGQQQIRLNMKEWEMEFGYSFGF